MAIHNIFIRSVIQHVPKSSISVSVGPFLNINYRSFSVPPAFGNTNLLSLFQRYGFSPSQLDDLLGKNEFVLSSPSEIEKYFKLLLSLKPSQDFLVSTVSSCPRVLELEFLEKWQKVILQLGINNVTAMAIKNVLEVAQKFGLSPGHVFKFLKCLKGLEFSDNTIASVLETVPTIIISNEDEIRGKVEFLMGIGIQRREIDRVFGLFPRISEFGVEKRLKPLLNEFEDLGFSLSDVRKEVCKDPIVLGLENGELSQCLEMLRSLKCRVAIKENIFRKGEFRAGYEVKLRVDCLRKNGLMYRDAFVVLWKEPRVILYGIEEIEKKLEFLVHHLRFDVQCLVEVPEYLGMNFDKQIVPRFQVIDHLRSNGGLGHEVSLRNLVKLSRLRFYNLYVKPYPECEKIYGRFSGEVQVQSRHPVGMWKLFKPQQYLRSGEDVKNIKSYVESLT